MGFPVTFVNPLFLAGLALAAAPALLHLLRRDPGRRVLFPAAMLLVSSGDVRVRRWSLAEVLLLLLRVLVVIGFVLALARPRVAVRGLGREERVLASVAIVVDDTPSMAVRTPEGSTRMAEARRAAAEIIERLQPGSRVRLQCASGLLLDAGVDLTEARRLAEGIAPCEVASGLPNALAESVAWLDSEPSPKELYVISDFQRSSWEAAKVRGPSYRVPLYAIDVGEGRPRDWAVGRVRVTEPRVTCGLVFEIRVEVTASAAGTRDLVIELGGREVRRERLHLAAGERTEVAFDLASREAGPLVGVARLVATGRGTEGAGEAHEPGEADDWPANDSRAFAVQVQPAVKALSVRPSQPERLLRRSRLGAASGDGALAGELVWRALAPFAGGERELVRVEGASPPLPAGHELQHYDCVVLVAPSALAAADWAALRSFVEDGGGLFVFADEGMSREGFPAETGGLLPASSARLQSSLPTVRLTRPDYEHPALRAFEGGANGRLEEVAFRRFLELGGLEETGSRVLGWFGGVGERRKEMPALVEVARGRGRVLLFASGPTARWGTLFREPVFVPFLHEAVAYLARSGPAQLAAVAGGRLRVKLHPSERGLSARLEDRSMTPPLVRELAVDAERLELPIGRLGKRGVYHIVTSGASGTRERAVAVGLDPREFDTERTDPAKLLGLRARLARSGAELAGVFARTRGGAEVTGSVAWATLVVFLAEMLVSARLTRRRSASQGSGANVRGAI